MGQKTNLFTDILSKFKELLYKPFSANKAGANQELLISEKLTGFPEVLNFSSPLTNGQPMADRLVRLNNIVFNPDLLNFNKIAGFSGLSQSYISQLLNNKKHNVNALVKLEKAIITLYEEVLFHVNDVSLFSQRELEIAPFLMKGLTSKEIGEKLGTSRCTINNQIDTMRKKCGAKNKTELVVYLIKNQLV